MALRRSHRPVEVFDISLMNVVTKAMGAFLVLMLMLYPHYQRLHAAQKRIDDAEAQSLLLAEQASTLRRQNQEIQDALAEEQRLEQRRQQLERNSAPGGQIATLLLSFSSADCDGADVDFYAEGEGLTLADGSAWPPVQRGPQAAPRGVLEYREAPGDLDGHNVATNVLTNLWVGFTGALAYEDVTGDLHRRAQRQKLWAIDGVRPNTGFEAYAKIKSVGGNPCVPNVGAVAIGQAGASGKATILRADLRFRQFRSTGVYDLGTVVWTGTSLEAIRPGPDAQTRLDQRLGLK